MSKFIDLSGNKYGRLTVVRRIGEKGIHPSFLCICDCGNEFIARADKLRDGRALSCGCMHQEQLKRSKSNTIVAGGGVFTTDEFVKLLNISHTTLYRLIKNGLTYEDIYQKYIKIPGGDQNGEQSI